MTRVAPALLVALSIIGSASADPSEVSRALGLLSEKLSGVVDDSGVRESADVSESLSNALLTRTLISQMGTANVSSASVLPPTSRAVGRRGRQFSSRRLSASLQSQLKAPERVRAPIYTRRQGIVSVSGPTRASRLQPPRQELVSEPVGPPGGPALFRPSGFGAAPPSPPEIGPPATRPTILLPPGVMPPGLTPPTVQPPGVRPPAPPTTTPPTAPPTTQTPAPPPTITGDGGIDVSEIRCIQTSSRESLAATILSLRPLLTPPVLVNRPAINPLTSSVCQVTSSDDGLQLSVSVKNLEACGVESCLQPDGERYLCLTIRFPVIAGIQLPEDDVIQIQCRPQDRSQTVGKQLSVTATGEESSTSPTQGRSMTFIEGFENLSPTRFSGGKQQFQCEMALFRRTAGGNMFSTVVQGGDTVSLGEELHLRTIIRDGDGWTFSKLTDVLVKRVTSDGSSLPTDSVPLVFSDGCRNDVFKIVAPAQPTRHQQNQLISNFAFRVFTFQGMASGDSLQISARVTGCVEAIDCAPTACSDGGQGFGRRRRAANNGYHGNTTDWRRSLASFSVVIPDSPRAAASATPAPPAAVSGSCPALLLGSLVAALACCLVLLCCAVCVLNARRRRQLKVSAEQPRAMPVIQQRHPTGSGGDVNYEFRSVAREGSAECGEFVAADEDRVSYLVVDAAVTAPRGRCTARQLKRRRADIRRSFSAGNIRCACAWSHQGDPEMRRSNVSIVQVPAQEDVYSELSSTCDVAPTMV